MCIRDSPTALHHQPDRVRLELPAELPPLAHANTLSPFHGLLQVSTLSRQVHCVELETEGTMKKTGKKVAKKVGKKTPKKVVKKAAPKKAVKKSVKKAAPKRHGSGGGH